MNKDIVKYLMVVFVVAATLGHVRVRAASCEERATSCGHCVSDFECFWCGSDDDRNGSCSTRGTFNLRPSCDRPVFFLYPSCTVSGKTVIIITAVVIALVGLLVMTCCGCCIHKLRKKRRQRQQDAEDASRRGKELRRVAASERRAERRRRYMDINRKS